MDADLLLTTLNLIAPMPAALEQSLCRYLKLEEFPKKHLLLKQGEIAKKIYFINTGFARAFYWTQEGKECTSWFMGKGDLMISVYSFYTQQPAAENMETIDESELLSMTWQQLQAIYADHPEFNFYGRLLTEKYYILADERMILLRTLSARERYERLLASHPAILRQASLGQVATYLGMSQETLSRVRAEKPDLTLVKKPA